MNEVPLFVFVWHGQLSTGGTWYHKKTKMPKVSTDGTWYLDL